VSGARETLAEGTEAREARPLLTGPDFSSKRAAMRLRVGRGGPMRRVPLLGKEAEPG
jgi:hypothetical protein